jgi:hypothetical protein
MTFTRSAKNSAHRAFVDHRPSAETPEEEALHDIVSALCFQPLEDGEMVVRLANADGTTIDLRTNPICAARLAISLLDLINRNGWLDVDLRISDEGEPVAHLAPNASRYVCDVVPE